MLFFVMPLLLVGIAFQGNSTREDATGVVKSELPSNAYSLEARFSGQVSSVVLPDFFNDATKMPSQFDDWAVAFDRVTVTKKKTLVLHSHKVKTFHGSKSATLLKAIPSIQQLVAFTTVDEFEDVLGQPQEKSFPDFGTWHQVADDKTTTHSTATWIVCCCESDQKIKYLRIVLNTSETLGKVSISDRWIQQGVLKKESSIRSKKHSTKVIKISSLSKDVKTKVPRTDN